MWSRGNKKFQPLPYSFLGLTEPPASFISSDVTYGLHTETVSTLLILLSTPMFSTKPSFQMKTFRLIMNTNSESAHKFTHRLLENFSERRSAPATYISEEGGSLVLGLASGVWNVLTFGYSSVANPPPDEESLVSSKGLSEMSLQLILVLTNHCTDSSNASLKNPYRNILFMCQNLDGKNNKPLLRCLC